MGNRNQDTYQSGQSRSRRQENWRDDEYSRGARTRSGSGEEYGSDYGSYVGSDEGESSVRAGSYDEGRYQAQSGRGRDSRGQSGSTGRYAGYGDFGQGNYGGGRSGWSGQDRYGQSGYGQGNYDQGGYGQGPRGQGRDDYGPGNYRGSSGHGSLRGWNEPYGEGQQYTSGGDYGGRGGEYGEEWRGPSGSQGYGGSQGHGSQGYGSQRYGSPQGYGSQGSQSHGSQGFGSQGYGSQGSQGFGSRGMGQHQGKGPKGYQRSDERIKEMLCERLREDPEIDPSEVSITVQGGKITLEGTVDSRQTKNAIEEAAEQCGVSDVQNNLRVQRASQQGSETQGRQGKGGASGDDNTATRQKQH
jgi:hypothetical protein